MREEKELRKIAVEYVSGQITFFQIEPFIQYEHTDKQTSKGFFYSHSNLLPDESATVKQFIEQYQTLTQDFINSKK